MTLQPTPLQDAYRYTKGQFRHTVCADCLASLEPCVEGNNKVVVEHWCRVTKRRFVVDMGSSEGEAVAAVARLDYLDAPNFPRAGFRDIYTTVNRWALTYVTTIQVNNEFTSDDFYRIMAQVPCELIVTIVLPLEFSLANHRTLTTAVFGLQQAFREALLCHVRYSNTYQYTFLPKFKQFATFHFGHKLTTLTMSVAEISDGMRFTWETAELAELSYRDCAQRFAHTTPLRQLAAIRGAIEAEARHMDFRYD